MVRSSSIDAYDKICKTNLLLNNMYNKIRVHGKAQNRTALGIVNAYLVMNPNATLDDLRDAFPDSLNPDSGVRINFVDMKKINQSQPENWNGFFSADDELLHLKDGTTVAVVKMWTKPSFERMVAKAEKYGIEIASFTEADKGFGKKGGYRLEYLNGYVPPVAEEPKKSNKKRCGLRELYFQVCWLLLAQH